MFTVSEVAVRFLAWLTKHRRPSTVEYYRYHLDRFCAVHGDRRVKDLRQFHLSEWGSRWHEVQSVKRCFRWACVEMELISRDPFAKVRRPRPGQRRRTLTREESARQLRHAGRALRDLLIGMRESIARPGELRSLQWDEIRRDDNRGTLEESLRAGQCYAAMFEHKTAGQVAGEAPPRIICINRRFGRLLARLHRRQGKPAGHVFLNRRGRPWTSNALRIAVRVCNNAAGLGVDRRGEQLVAYSYRHTAATAAAICGVRDKALAEVMGHTSTRCTQRYLHLVVDHLRQLMLSAEDRRRQRKLI